MTWNRMKCKFSLQCAHDGRQQFKSVVTLKMAFKHGEKKIIDHITEFDNITSDLIYG